MVGNRKINKQAGPKKQANQFSLDIDLKGVMTLLTLVTLTMITVFYLGMVYGKAQRDPNAPQTTPLSEGLTGLTEQVTPKNLDLYQMKEDDTGLKSLQTEFSAMSEKADTTKGQVDSQVKLDQEIRSQSDAHQAVSTSTAVKPDTTAVTSNIKVEKAKPKEASWPDNVKKVVPTGKRYFVQVVATAYKSRADSMVKLLRKKGYNAYIREVKLETRTLYRVRVGDNNLEEINKIKARLGPVLQGSGSKLMIYQILKK